MPQLILLVVACTGSPVEDTGPRLCNGSAAACDRPLTALSLVRSHNSHASEERGYHPFAMNHYPAIPTQLADGVRSLNVDLYEVDGELVACHGVCELGSQPVDELWDEIEGHLAGDPDAVVLLDVQDEAPAGVVNASLAGHALSARAWTQPAGEPWPTLGELLDAGGQLVYFNTPVDGDPAWVLPHGDFVYGTGWSYQRAEDLDCAVQGEVLEHGLYEVTHVLTNPIASPAYAEEINTYEVLSEHLLRCRDEVGRPNLVSVDYYTIGEVFRGVAALDG